MKYLILGGTGTLGKAVIQKLLSNPHHQVKVFSRGEMAQKQVSEEFKHHSKLSFCIGDIRDREAVFNACAQMDVVFHFAALKHVDILEENPEESVKTNVLGTIQVADACIHHRISHCVFSSTDKAVEPVNVYGMSKGISERILIQRNKIQSITRFKVFRWGNVCASRGSAIPHFIKTLKNESKVYLTHPEMTRFWIRVEDAVDFMLSHYQQSEEVLIPPIQSASVKSVIQCLSELMGVTPYQIEVVGLRPGEKIHEKLSQDQCSGTCEPMNSQELKMLLHPIVREFS